VESFVYKWQTFLGGIASAGILAVGVAAPALAQAAPATNGSTSTGVAQTLGGAACQLTGLPMAGEVASASGALTMTGSCSSSGNTSNGTSGNTLLVNDSPKSTQTPSGANASGITSLPGLNTVGGMIPGLSSATSQVPAVGSLTGSSSSNSSSNSSNSNAAFNPDGSPAGAPAGGTSNSSVIPGSLSGLTGALPVGSLTGSLPNVGGVTGVLSGVTGSGQ
jgi:hypothetical protein